jgi:predicted ribosomally synthesized peptide with SipW-like signal peptide
MKKIGLISLALVLAMGGLGVGYAKWSDTITINGPVTTGSVLLGFEEITPTEDPEWLGKDIAQFTAVGVNQVGVHWSDYYQAYLPIYDQINATITNGYPCYYAHLVFTIANGGTIPVHITSFTLTDPTGELTFVWVTPPPASPAYGVFWKDYNGNGTREPATEDVISIQLVNLVCTQIEPCEAYKAELDFHIEQPALMNHTYRIVGTIVGEQWAE